MDLTALRIFLAVAEERSFTTAARRLNLSQPPLSQQIQALEASLGHDLFERRGRSLVLTEATRQRLARWRPGRRRWTSRTKSTPTSATGPSGRR